MNIDPIHSFYMKKVAKIQDLGYNKYGENMKKNAFTLVELMAVITILAIIMVISLPSLVGILKNNTEKQYQDFLDNLYIMAENYVATYPDQFEDLKTPGSQATIMIYQLKQAEYFNTNPTNPQTNEPVSDFDAIKVTRNENKTYSYEFVLSSNS